MENANVYNNGSGWRISFPIGRVIQVLTVEEAMDLHDVLEAAITYAESASHQGNPADTERTMTESVQQPEIKFCEVCGTPIGCR